MSVAARRTYYPLHHPHPQRLMRGFRGIKPNRLARVRFRATVRVNCSVDQYLGIYDELQEKVEPQYHPHTGFSLMLQYLGVIGLLSPRVSAAVDRCTKNEPHVPIRRAFTLLIARRSDPSLV